MTQFSFSISVSGSGTDSQAVKDAFTALVNALGTDGVNGALTLQETEVISANDVLTPAAPAAPADAVPA